MSILTQSLWLDEAIVANVVKNYNLWDIITNFSVADFHPPLYYLFMKLWTNIFAYSEMSLRFPSIIFFLITVWVVYKINKKASLLVLLNPLLIYYAFEARMYMMVVMFLTLALFNKLKNRNFYFYLFSCLSVLTFYGSVFYLFFLSFLNWGMVAGILIVSPLLFLQLKYATGALVEVKNWGLTLGNVNFKNIFLIPIKFITGRIDFEKWQLLPVLITWMGILTKKIKINFYLKIILGPLILALIVSLKFPMMQYFRFLYLLIPFCILLATNLKKTWQYLLIISIFIYFSFFTIFDENNFKEDWKSLAKDLNKEIPVYMIGSFADPLTYYNKEVKIFDIKIREPNEEKITYIPYGQEIHGINNVEILEKLGYKKEEDIIFRGVSLEKWKLNH